MKLIAKKRLSEKKSEIKSIRRQGNIPAVIYSPGSENVTITVETTAFETILREMEPGLLPTMVFDLELDQKKLRAIIKDVQYDITTYKVIHLDFEELKDDVPVKVNVPINCLGAAESAGVKAGGFFRQVIRKVKVQCLPKDIPEQFEVDVRELNIGQSKKISDLSLPKGVRALAPANEVMVVVAKNIS